MIHDDRLPLSKRSRFRGPRPTRLLLAGIAAAFAFAGVAPATALAEKCYPKTMYRDYWHNRNIFDTMKRSEKRLMPLPREVARKWTHERKTSFWRGSSFAEFDVWWRVGALLKIRKEAWRAKTRRSRVKQKRFDACKERNRAANKKAAEARKAREKARKKKMFDEYFAEKARYYTKGEIMCLNSECRRCQGGTCVFIGMRHDLHENPKICPGTDDTNDLKENRSFCRKVRRDRERAANPRPRRQRPKRRPTRRRR